MQEHSSTSNDAYQIARAAKSAFESSQLVTSDQRVHALSKIREELAASKDAIFAANQEDVKASNLLFY